MRFIGHIAIGGAEHVASPPKSMLLYPPPPPRNISINSMLGPSNGPPYQAIFFAVFAVM